MEIGKRLSGVDGLPDNRFDVPSLQAVLFRDRNLAAEIVLDDLLRACAGKAAQADADLRDGCAALDKRDRRSNVESARRRCSPRVLDARAYHPERPCRGVRCGGPSQHAARPAAHLQDGTVGPAVFGALKEAVVAMRAAGFALDAPLGDVQAAISPAGRIALHGGEEYEGVLNKLTSQPVSPQGASMSTSAPATSQTVGFHRPRAGGAGAAGPRSVGRSQLAPRLGPDAGVLGQTLDFTRRSRSRRLRRTPS